MPADVTCADRQGFFATYCVLDDTSGDSHIRVDGNMTVIGAELDFTREMHVTHRGKEVPRIVLSRGTNAMGFVPASLFRRLDAMLDAGWTCRAVASTSVYDKLAERFSTEVAVICAAPDIAEAAGIFADRAFAKIARGSHPDINLSAKELSAMLGCGGQWDSPRESSRITPGKGAAYYKTRQTATERMALAAASGSIGCWVALAVCVLAVLVAVVCVLVL